MADNGFETRAISFSDVQRVSVAPSSATKLVSYRSYEVPTYMLADPYIVDERHVVATGYGEEDKPSSQVTLFDMQTEASTYYMPMRDGWTITDVVADAHSIYWVEQSHEYSHYIWAIVRQPRDGSKPTRIRSKGTTKQAVNVPQLAFDGRFLVWMERAGATWSTAKTIYVVYDAQTEQVAKLANANQYWQMYDGLHVEQGKVCFIDRSDSASRYLIRCFDAARRKEELRLTAGNRMLDQVSYDGTRAVFSVIEDEKDRRGKQYSYDLETGVLHCIVDSKREWLNDMSGDNMLVEDRTENGSPAVYLSARNRLLRLPKVEYEGRPVVASLGSMKGNRVAMPASQPMGKGVYGLPEYWRYLLVVYELPVGWM